MTSEDASDDSTAVIGRCEILFCPAPASEVLFIEVYGRKLALCSECYENRTTPGHTDTGTKREQFGDMARGLLDDE